MNRNVSVSRGMVAGFTATVVLSVIMLVKSGMGLMPELNVIRMLTHMLGASTPAVGWAVHFLIGTVLWGALFASLASRLPGPLWWRGVLFAAGAWLLMMIVMMPMAGAGFFGLDLGIAAPVMTLMLHVVYGAVLGSVYSTLCRGIGSVSHPTPGHA